MFGNRGIYHEGWTAVTKHMTPWLPNAKLPPFDQDRWELYDTTKDWSQSQDLAKHLPDKLEELKRLWLIEAARYNVLPIDDRLLERLDSDMAGRPDLLRGRTDMMFGAGMGRLGENVVPNIKNKSFAITAELEIPDRGAEGVILSQGGRFGGWSLYARSGKLRFCYNFVGMERYCVESQQALPSGKHQVRAEFAYDGGGLGKGGTLTLFVDGKQVGSGRIDRTQGYAFSADETLDVGCDPGSPVVEDYPANNVFTGKINWVNESIGPADSDHLIDKEELLKIAMVKQ
jgi:arylsulfatase